MIYRAVVLALFAFTVSEAQAVLGANKCTFGPAHWCASLENAKACGKGSQEFCRQKVWVGSHPLANWAEEKVAKPKELTEEQKEKIKNKMVNKMMGGYTEHKVGGNCQLCELIAREAFSKLKNNATEDEIIGDMEKLCDIIPSSYEESCRNFVEEYGKEFWEAFINNVDVHDLCTYLGLCSAEFLSIVKVNNVMGKVLAKNVAGIECDTCSAVMGLVQKEVLQNEEALEGLLDEICSTLPVDQSQCDDTINGMFEALVSLFESYTTTELCQMIGMCSSMMDTLLGPGPVALGQDGQTAGAALLGQDDSCQNGPAYWCASPENAKECQMEQYCKEQADALVF